MQKEKIIYSKTDLMVKNALNASPYLHGDDSEIPFIAKEIKEGNLSFVYYTPKDSIH